MKYNDFIHWLSGFVSAIQEPSIEIQKIKEALRNVRFENESNFINYVELLGQEIEN